ncbi:hypothetical protein Acav_1546 [Paracidovorax avenae ATCC 19860]|uniref:Uncharacterized protein n=1 Tax=Paracidovorax avenae (strain ATCC 19860 / DSM 7227 / CCUG 15838 / JCM 20985 / LMG 2117 / NCPPB 1011) TaxID=643561 RepID=F0Q3T9_PARA1|nr:hypothetical protein Acav_1546 [Paracidovorax avenae ATCC 19860]
MRAGSDSVGAHVAAKSSRAVAVSAAALLFSMGWTTVAVAATAPYPLDWPHAGETLIYHSCGCADACWVAEVRDARTRALKARLRCGCETLHYQPASHASEAILPGGCEPINGSRDKPAAIRERLEQLRGTHSPPQRPASR